MPLYAEYLICRSIQLHHQMIARGGFHKDERSISPRSNCVLATVCLTHEWYLDIHRKPLRPTSMRPYTPVPCIR